MIGLYKRWGVPPAPIIANRDMLALSVLLPKFGRHATYADLYRRVGA